MAKKKRTAGKKNAKKRLHVLKKKKSAARKKRTTRVPKKKVKPETFELGIPRIETPHHFAQARIAPEEEILRLPELPKPEALRTIEHKKRIPHAVTAVLAGALLALFSLFVFSSVLLAGETLSFSLSAAIFVGFSIFLYNRLEKS